MKYIIVLFLVILKVNYAQSQEISIYFSGGMSGKKYSFEKGEANLKLGGAIGIGYAYELNFNWSILSGVEIAVYGNKVTLNNNYNYANYLIDDQGSAFEYRLRIARYSEVSSFKSVNIPLMIQFHPENFKIPMYVNFGGKLHFPIKQTIESTAENIQLSGYYPNFDLEITNLPKHGFGAINALNNTVINELKTAVSLSVEIGAILKVEERNQLYAGFYLDYGITEIQKKSANVEEPIIAYSSLGIKHAKINNELIEVIPLQDMVKTLAFGVQFKYVFVKKRKKHHGNCF